MSHNITITLEDIAEVAHSFECDFSDKHRQEALQCKVSRDIQACPGSGKTTLLVAKLAILSRKWRWKDRGICVLSHTNVARQEVEKRLSSQPTAHHLLNYPHFIGTIQVFIDRFLALPYLRNRGVEDPMVDNQRHKVRVFQILERRKYTSVRRHFSHRGDTEKLLGHLRLEFVNGEFKIGSAAGNLGLKDKTKRTYKLLIELKKRLWREGLFRYDEMYAIAQAYIHEYPNFTDALRFRFPWVFIDEMQDTDILQEQLLTQLFSTKVVMQRFGDVNQSIFNEIDEEGKQTCFPSLNPICLPDSKRFGEHIATSASRLTVVASQTIQGNSNRAEGIHSVFLFDKDTISQVLPAFGNLIADRYSEQIPHVLPVKAVGGRKSPPSKPQVDRLPYSIGDYWPDFCPEATTKSNVPTSFIGFVREARDELIRHQQWYVAYHLLLDGVLDLLRRQQATGDKGRSFTKSRLVEALKSRGEIYLYRLQELLFELGSRHDIDENYWQQTRLTLINLLSPLCDKLLTPSAEEFLGWVELHPDRIRPEHALRGPINVYKFESDGLAVDIEVTTIHAVKGETHFATLVLETFWHKHDLPELIPFMIDQQDRKDLSKIMTGKRAKRVFVGMTRPQELLCLAIDKNHLSESQIESLRSNGWKIEDLTNRGTENAH
jgi:hypothetical protein